MSYLTASVSHFESAQQDTLTATPGNIFSSIPSFTAYLYSRRNRIGISRMANAQT